jgi:hypothetical protein
VPIYQDWIRWPLPQSSFYYNFGQFQGRYGIFFSFRRPSWWVSQHRKQKINTKTNKRGRRSNLWNAKQRVRKNFNLHTLEDSYSGDVQENLEDVVVLSFPRDPIRSNASGGFEICTFTAHWWSPPSWSSKMRGRGRCLKKFDVLEYVIGLLFYVLYTIQSVYGYQTLYNSRLRFVPILTLKESIVKPRGGWIGLYKFYFSFSVVLGFVEYRGEPNN